jgi:hypothetical protein
MQISLEAHPEYSAVSISWEDVQRDVTTKGIVSTFGRNISDVRIVAEERSGPLFTIRRTNWDESLRTAKASDVSIVVADGPQRSRLKTVTLAEYISDSEQHMGYAGIRLSEYKDEVSNPEEVVTMRFQCVMLPAGDKNLQFCTSVFNYQTVDNADPKNMVVLCTAQGASVATSQVNSQLLMAHAGLNSNKWLTAEPTDLYPGQSQIEPTAAIVEHITRGKATAAALGIREMGAQMNCQLLVQIPLMQKYEPVESWGFDEEVYRGICNVARVSHGNKHSERDQVSNIKTYERHDSQCITITATMYYMLEGKQPSAEDLRIVIAQLDDLYGPTATTLSQIPQDSIITFTHESLTSFPSQ